jgi:hypothetical protein
MLAAGAWGAAIPKGCKRHARVRTVFALPPRYRRTQCARAAFMEEKSQPQPTAPAPARAGAGIGPTRRAA